MVNTIIFDFDGTIADTEEVGVNAFNKVSRRFNLPPITEKEINQFKNLGAKPFMKIFFQTHKLNPLQVPGIILRVRKEIAKNIKFAKPFADMPETVKSLKESGFQLGILTGNSEENVNVFLQNYYLTGFDFVHSQLDLFGKARSLRSILRELHKKPAEVIYVGDEVRDIEASHKVGIKAIAVTWGYNTKGLLESAKPDVIVDNPSQIIDYLLNQL